MQTQKDLHNQIYSLDHGVAGKVDLTGLLTARLVISDKCLIMEYDWCLYSQGQELMRGLEETSCNKKAVQIQL